MESLSISIPESFLSYLDSLQVRMGYLYPEIELSYREQAAQIEVSFDEHKVSAQEIRKEIWLQLYREKVYQDTLSIRKRLYGNG